MKYLHFIKNHRALFFSLLVFALFGGVIHVFALPYKPSDLTTDPTCAPTDSNCYVTPVNIGDVVGSATNDSILYINNSGALAQDTGFTRDAVTQNTVIGRSVGTIANSLTLDTTGNFLSWNADTTDNILDVFQQYQDIGGSGIKGNAIIHENTTTGETANLIVGDFSAVPGQPFVAQLAYQNPSAKVVRIGIDSTELRATYANQTSHLGGELVFQDSGNTITWDGDSTDDLQDIIAQGPNILGTDISGIALAHKNMVTGDLIFTALGDGTSAGGRPFELVQGLTNPTLGINNILDQNDQKFEVKLETGGGATRQGFVIDTTSIRLGDIFDVDNQTLLTINDANKKITGVVHTDANKSGGLDIGSYVLGSAVPDSSVLSWSNTTTGYVSLVGVGDFTPAGGPSTHGFVGTDMQSNFDDTAQVLITAGNNSQLTIRNLITQTYASQVKVTPSDIQLNYQFNPTIADQYNLLINNTGVSFGDLSTTVNGTKVVLNDITKSVNITSPTSSGIVLSVTNADGTCTLDPGDVGGWSCPSDINLKKDVNTLVDSEIQNIMNLRPVTYRFKSEDDSTPLTTGLIAQEVQTVFPRLVETQTDGTLTLNYSGFTPYLIKAIQEMNIKLQSFSDLTGDGNTFAETIRTWLASVTNGIQNLFAKTAHVEELCIGTTGNETCLNKDQVDSLISTMSSTNQTTSSTSNSNTSDTVENTGSSDQGGSGQSDGQDGLPAN